MFNNKNNKGFTLVELLTVIAILAVILLIAAPTILGVLDKARKNTFKNQILLYAEGLKQQTALSAMGDGYSELQKYDTDFYSPTSDSFGKLVRVSIDKLNKVMDNQVLTGDSDRYLYVEWSSDGYNYYIGEGVRKQGEFKTTCQYATGREKCIDKIYNSQTVSLINLKVLSIVHITRDDLVSSNSNDVVLAAPVIEVNSGASGATVVIPEGVTSICVNNTNNSGTCNFESVNNQSTVSLPTLNPGTYYVFIKNIDGVISPGTEYTVPLVSGNIGDQITLNNYKWHIVGKDTTNNRVYILLDVYDGNGTSATNKQTQNMTHCMSVNDSTNNCTFNGSIYVYSWDKSLIRKYLNDSTSGFLSTLDSSVKNKLVKQEVCKDLSAFNSAFSYGGYTKEEIESIGATCINGYTDDYIRLMTPSEYHNLSQYFDTPTDSYPIASVGDVRTGKIAGVNYITRLAANDWLYSGGFWLTGAVNAIRGTQINCAYNVDPSGSMIGNYGNIEMIIRPILVIQN